MFKTILTLSFIGVALFSVSVYFVIKDILITGYIVY